MPSGYMAWTAVSNHIMVNFRGYPKCQMPARSEGHAGEWFQCSSVAARSQLRAYKLARHENVLFYGAPHSRSIIANQRLESGVVTIVQH